MITGLKSQIYNKLTQSVAMMLFMFFVSSMSFAQSSYGLIYGSIAKESITRVWLDDPPTWIDYSFDGTAGTFYLRVDGSSVVASAKMKGRKVTDFEILHDTVFFCGYYNDTNAFVGYFDIANMFAGADVFTVFDSLFFDQVYKIAVYNGSDCTHLAVIGHSFTYGYGISDVKLTSPVIEYYYCEPSEIEVFEDVDVTDHYVVAVENKGTPHGSHYMRIFDKASTPSFLYSSVGQNIYGAYNDSYSKNFVTHITGDKFAVVALAIRPNNIYGNNILLYNGTTYVGSIFTPLWNYFDTQWCIRDFRFCSNDNMLYLLEDMTRSQQGSIEPMIFQYDYSIPTIPVKAFYTPSDVFLRSIDCAQTGVILGSGPHSVTSELYSFQWNFHQTFNCLNNEVYNNTNPNPGPIVFPHVFTPYPNRPVPSTIMPIIKSQKYIEICD